MGNVETKLSGNVGDSRMRAELAPSKARATSSSGGPQQYALAIATVLSIDYEKLEVSLITGTGEPFARIPIPISFPGAGHRHFLGALPEPGDACVIGWGMQESGRTRVPWILSWIVPGTTAGYDWLPTQPYSPDESGTSPKLAHAMEGTLDRIRHKLRHMEPGNVVASSSQGADVVLNESVFLANRRGNELQLRDQDQAIIFRSLQQFHAGAGFRIYSGMVQRDATFLPTQMFADSIDWDSAQQRDGEGVPITTSGMPSSDYSLNALTPAAIFQRDGDGTPDLDLIIPAGLNPYEFLPAGMFIDQEGNAQPVFEADAIYGGKAIYRLSSSGTNATVDTGSETFTEYRIEVSHTTDGTLPVTEQTDGFDANRLPEGNPDDPAPLDDSIDTPFIDFVLGTVAGNDPYSEKGRTTYGIPLRPVIFDGDDRSPALVSGIGSDMGSHSATLLQVKPPLVAGSPSFWSVTKDGRLLASLEGTGSSWSTEASFGAGLRIGAGTEPGGCSLKADLDGAFVVQTQKGRNADNLGILFSSTEGAVKLYAGGTSQEGGVSARNAPSGGGEADLPALILESGTNALLKAAGTLTLSANKLAFENIGAFSVGANTSLEFNSGAGISHSGNTYALSSTGKATFNYSGPKDSIPTNGSVRKVSFTSSPATGFVGGTADEYEMLYGDRDESITLGNHSTTVMVGNQTYECNAGILSLKSGVSTAMELTTASMSGRASALSFQATAGAASIQSSAALSLQGQTASLTAPSVTVNGGHTPPGGAPGGGVLTDGVLDPITGRPFMASGVLGVQTFRVN